MITKKKLLALWITFALFLTCIDQLIKLIIYNKFMESRFSIIQNFIYFNPHFNEDISWYNVKYGLNMNWGISTLFSILILLIFLYQAKVHYIEYQDQTLAVFGYSTLISGAVASVLDKILWGTSLDYIEIKNWIIFDLKDLYITLGILLFLIGYFMFEIQKYKNSSQSIGK